MRALDILQRQPTSVTRGIALAAPLLAILYIEVFRYFDAKPPAPFIALFAAVLLASLLDGRRGGSLAALIAAAYMVQAYLTGFGPEYLIGTPFHLVFGIMLFAMSGIALGAFRDRMARMNAELADYADSHYRALVEDAPEAICVADDTGHIIRVNPRFREMFRLGPEDRLPDNIGDISPEEQEGGRSSGELATEYLRHVISAEPLTFEWRHLRTNGEVFDTEVALARLPADGKLLVRGLIRDVTERKRIDRLRHGETELLRRIAADTDLKSTLEQLTRVVESVIPGSICTILYLDEDRVHVRHGASPRLSTIFSEAIDGEPIGPQAGSCGTAMFFNETIITADIQLDPHWDNYRPLAEAEGLRSCWSIPIRDYQGDVRGSLAVYFHEPRNPLEAELGILERLCSIAGIAFESARKSEAIAHNAEVFQATFEEAAVGMAQVDPNGNYISVNREFANLLGYEEAELESMNFRQVAHPDDVADMAKAVEGLANGAQENFHAETRGVRKDGSTVWVNLSIGTVRHAGGELERMVVVAQDISRAHELSEQLVYEVKHDSLTGLTNRREFERHLVSLLRDVNNEETSGAFLYLDLDQFKLVNDTAGHIAGDALLRQLAPILTRHVRNTDIVARLGGDEFGVLLRGCNEKSALHVAHNLLTAIRDFVFTWGNRNFRISGSVGAVLLEADQFPSATDVMQIADTVCYAAKDAGRDRILVWQEDDEQLYARRGEMEWVPRLNTALEKGDLFLAGQPIVSLSAEDNTTWLELLIRLRDGEQEIPPGAFMPAAERYGLAPRIDWFVIRAAIGWLRKQDGDNHRLSINLSGLTISDTNFLNQLTELLAEIGPLARQLCFEITETAAIANLSDATRLIETVRRYGCTFALDDFGSGLSSFSYLRNLPVDFIKIDGSFVRDMVGNPIDTAIIQAIRHISNTMQKKTIAEFIESEAIVAELRKLDIDYGQGFYLGRPATLIHVDHGDGTHGVA